jgi:hypothetical protein
LKMTTYTKESESTNYGHGNPGYGWEVRIYRDGRRIARAFGPNVSGPMVGEFRDIAAVRQARELPDGEVAVDLVLPLLKPWVADQLSTPVSR